jgi:hypothetical protein
MLNQRSNEESRRADSTLIKSIANKDPGDVLGSFAFEDYLATIATKIHTKTPNP